MSARKKKDDENPASELEPQVITEDSDSSASYEGLARRYRPQDFASVVGQGHVVRTLSRALDSRRWAPAYLFVGGRGLGKTTMARLLAKGVNCQDGPTSRSCGRCGSCVDIAASRDIDVLEIDAASHTGVDNVRELIIQSAATAPSRGRAKIFIIDEVHMLSAAAFNALLKTIEEPPPGIIFILATTDGHKVPPTIRSRCQRFDFRPITREELTARLQEIATTERITIDAESLALICDYAEGGVRDALSALDLVRSYGADRISLSDTEDALGLIASRTLERMMGLIASGDSSALLVQLAEVLATGADPGEILRGLLGGFRRALLRGLKDETASARGRLVRSIEAILIVADRTRYSRFPRLELETLLCRLAHMAEDEVTLTDLYNRLVAMEAETPTVSIATPVAKPQALGTPLTSPATREIQPREAADQPHEPAGAPHPTDVSAKLPESTPKKADDPNSETVAMLERIFNAEVVEMPTKR